MCYNGYMDKRQEEKRISIRFPLDVLQGIRAMAREHERSFNGEIIWILRQYLQAQSHKESR